MGSWIFMLIVNLLIPITMLVFGCYFIKHAPKKINAIFGYRTARSMKNKDTWEFAHHHIGKNWRIFGLVLFALTMIIMLLIIEKPDETIDLFGIIICIIQCAFLVISILPTEIALKNNFDEHGNRRESKLK
ncbi:MAG: SdpI family protein [Clostridia bacterium]